MIRLRWFPVVALIVVAHLLEGCTDRLKWTEQVRLPDGRVVKLERYQEFDGPSAEPFGPPTESEYSFEFRMPGTGDKVRWRDKGELATVALTIDDGVPTLLTTPRTGGSLWHFRCLSPPYLAFQYQDGNWVRMRLNEVPRRIWRPNMTAWGVDELRPFIKANGRFLTPGLVESHLTYEFRGQLIDLTDLDRQEFDNLQRCNGPLNFMLRPDTGVLE